MKNPLNQIPSLPGIQNWSPFLHSLVFAVAAFLVASCGRTGPKPVNDDNQGELKHSIPSGQTGTGGVKNRDNTSDDAGKGISGTRPDDNIPIPPSGR